MFDDQDQDAGVRTVRVINWLGIIALMGMLFLLASHLVGCTGSNLPPCAPFCYPTPPSWPTWIPTGIPALQTRTPTMGASPSATALESRTPSPAPSSTSTRTPSPPPASPTAPPPTAATPFQTTGGQLALELDLAGFVPVNGLDTYTFSTICWEKPDPPNRPTSDCVQLALRGSKMPPCRSKPCAGAMAVEVRASSNLYFDGLDIDPDTPGTQYRPESQMCGEGLKPPRWLPLGAPTATGTYLVTMEWGPAFGPGVTVQTAAAAATLTQGLERPGFGWWIEGIPCDASGRRCGVGYGYKEDWTTKAHGGKTMFRAFQVVEPLQIHGHCP